MVFWWFGWFFGGFLVVWVVFWWFGWFFGCFLWFLVSFWWFFGVCFGGCFLVVFGGFLVVFWWFLVSFWWFFGVCFGGLGGLLVSFLVIFGGFFSVSGNVFFLKVGSKTKAYTTPPRPSKGCFLEVFSSKTTNKHPLEGAGLRPCVLWRLVANILLLRFRSVFWVPVFF